MGGRILACQTTHRFNCLNFRQRQLLKFPFSILDTLIDFLFILYLSLYQCKNLWALHYVADITDRMDFIKQKLWLPPPQIGSLSPGFQATCVQIMVNVGDNWWGWVIADIQGHLCGQCGPRNTGSFIWFYTLDLWLELAALELCWIWSWVVAICCSLLVVLLHFPPAKRRHPGKVNMHWGEKSQTPSWSFDTGLRGVGQYFLLALESVPCLSFWQKEGNIQHEEVENWQDWHILQSVVIVRHLALTLMS